MFDADATRAENMESLRKCVEGTGLAVAEHNGLIRFGRPPTGSDDTGFHALSDTFTAGNMREAIAFASGVRKVKSPGPSVTFARDAHDAFGGVVAGQRGDLYGLQGLYISLYLHDGRTAHAPVLDVDRSRILMGDAAESKTFELDNVRRVHVH